MNYEAPAIDVRELQAFVEAVLPGAGVTCSCINPQYQSWRLEIKADNLWYEYSWGPLSGFGFTDVNAEIGEDDNPFAPYQILLTSMEEAKDCLLTKRKERV